VRSSKNCRGRAGSSARAHCGAARPTAVAAEAARNSRRRMVHYLHNGIGKRAVGQDTRPDCNCHCGRSLRLRGLRPLRRLTDGHCGPKLCLSPQPFRCKFEFQRKSARCDGARPNLKSAWSQRGEADASAQPQTMICPLAGYVLVSPRSQNSLPRLASGAPADRTPMRCD
jgi:hypothetical protein